MLALRTRGIADTRPFYIVLIIGGNKVNGYISKRYTPVKKWKNRHYRKKVEARRKIERNKVGLGLKPVWAPGPRD